MDEYIERAALMSAFENAEKDDIEFYGIHIAECFPAERACEIARGVPAADVVEVVRCRDCKHCDISYPAGKPTPWYLCKRLSRTVVKPNAFCSYGERRDDHAAD